MTSRLLGQQFPHPFFGRSLVQESYGAITCSFAFACRFRPTRWKQLTMRELPSNEFANRIADTGVADYASDE